MPELPEAETISRQLKKKVIGLTIVDVEVLESKVIRIGLSFNLDEKSFNNKPAFKAKSKLIDKSTDLLRLSTTVNTFISEIKGAKIEDVGRRGKAILIYLSNNNVLIIHLKIAGSLLYQREEEERLPKTQVVLKLNNGYELRFRDYRKFGFVKLAKVKNLSFEPELKELGAEPLDDSFTIEVFQNLLRKRLRSKIKALLLDQSFIAGIGNIYADEILFYARVMPDRLASDLKEEEVLRIHSGIKKILTKAIEERGSSIATYTDLMGSPGNFTNFLKVYGKAGKPCPNDCKGIIEKIKIAGRGTHFCRNCQK